MGARSLAGVIEGPASMGPRPLGRGWLAHIRVMMGQTLSFNGAATARSRMAVGEVKQMDQEAALQWGRDR